MEYLSKVKKHERELVVANHMITEKDLEYEKKNIKNLCSPNTPVKLSFYNMYFPFFYYEKISLTVSEQELPPYAECFIVQFDDSGTFLACGYSNGYVNIFNIVQKAKPVSFKASDYPITSLRWNKKHKTTLIVVSCNGQVTHWHSTTGKILHKLEEKDNGINSVDYSNDFRHFCTGGNDVTVRVYDESTKTLNVQMKPYKFDQPGHSSRIFCVKFNPENANSIISGGWDKTIQFYDVREGKIVNSLYGPHICGEAIDINGYYVLSAAWSTSKQIQLWDVRMMKEVCGVKWENGEEYYPTYLYCAKFNTLKEYPIFGVTGVNNHLYRLFDFSKFDGKEENAPKSIFAPQKFMQSTFTLDFVQKTQKKELFACGCGDGGARVFSFDVTSKD